MNVEARLVALEERVSELEHEMRVLKPKLDQVLDAVVDVHNDVRELRKDSSKLRNDLPEIIARAVAPLIADLKDS